VRVPILGVDRYLGNRGGGVLPYLLFFAVELIRAFNILQETPRACSFNHNFFLLTRLYALDRSIVAVYIGRSVLDSFITFFAAA
jgi:hypothetical protein